MSAAPLTHRRGAPSPPRRLAYASFLIMLGGWIAFAVALATAPETLDDVWSWVRDLPLLLEGLAWLIGFPFLLGLAIWQAGWDDSARLLVIGVLAVAYTYMFRPRNS